MTSQIYLDSHATTPVSREVVDAMWPYFVGDFANAGSVTHQAGREAARAVDDAIQLIAKCLGCEATEIVATSGATEAINLAIFGYCEHPLQRRRKIVSVRTEHPAVLGPLERLANAGWQIDWIPVLQDGHGKAGLVDLDAAAALIDDQTALVAVMLANNEIGVIQPIKQLGELTHRQGAVLMCDATAAAGRMPIDVRILGVDLMAFSAHKFYGPKGVGGLYIRSGSPRIRLRSQIIGGGQQGNIRSGTLNVPGLVGMAAALQRACQRMPDSRSSVGTLRNRLWDSLHRELGDDIVINGPQDLRQCQSRLEGNLNVRIAGVEAATLMLHTPQLAFSSGSACSSADPQPSHVLLAIGLTVDQARCSARFGLLESSTADQIDAAAQWLLAAAKKLRA